MRVVQWFSGLHCCITQCGFEPWPSEFIRTVFVRVKPQFLPTVSRNIGQELSGTVWVCAVFICVSSIINWCPVVSVSPPAAHCFRLHRLWPWMGVRSKKKTGERKTIICSWQCFHVFKDQMYQPLTCGGILLTALVFIFQTWKTSRLTEEALYQSAKVKEWFCCAALHRILEVTQHILTFNDISTQLATHTEN